MADRIVLKERESLAHGAMLAFWNHRGVAFATRPRAFERLEVNYANKVRLADAVLQYAHVHNLMLHHVELSDDFAVLHLLPLQGRPEAAVILEVSHEAAPADSG